VASWISDALKIEEYILFNSNNKLQKIIFLEKIYLQRSLNISMGLNALKDLIFEIRNLSKLMLSKIKEIPR
jgi:hypothetical protein